jgi:hypothetical protein
LINAGAEGPREAAASHGVLEAVVVPMDVGAAARRALRGIEHRAAAVLEHQANELALGRLRAAARAGANRDVGREGLPPRGVRPLV